MPGKVRTVALVAKPIGEEAMSLAEELHDFLLEHGCRVLLEGALAKRASRPMATVEAIRKVDLCVVVGGDGTLIHAVRLLDGAEVPVFGVNAGALGFLTEIPRAQARDVLLEALEGRYQAQPRMKLRIRLFRKGTLVADADVLNDAVINRGALARMVDLVTAIDGVPVTSFRADGVIVSTPTGSTAYNLAANGPILSPSLAALIVNPICPHTLTQRPLVVSDQVKLTIEVAAGQGEILLSLDGQIGENLLAGDRVEIERSTKRALLVKNPSLDYFEILRAKLHWGA